GTAMGLNRQLLWFMAVRVVIITTILITAILIHFTTGEFFAELNTIYTLVSVTYLLTIVYALLLVFWKSYLKQLYIQLLGDVLLISGLVYITGGIVSPFPFLYILSIITGSILLYRRGGFVTATASCIAYWSLVDLMYLNVLPPVKVFQEYAPDLRPDHFYYNLAITVFGFYSVALMTGYLAENVRKAKRTIADKSEDLAKLSAFHRDVITSMMHGLVTTDEERQISSANPEAGRLLELREVELLGKPIDKVFNWKQSNGPPLETMLSGSGSYHFESEIKTKDDRTRIFGVKVSKLHDGHGDFQGYLYLLEDLTEIKALEREIRLKEQMAVLGEIAAGIAHEIRNPLAAMSGSVQMLKSADLKGEQYDLMDIFLRESDRLNRIIEDFLYYARPAEPLLLKCSVSKILKETASLLKHSKELSDEHEVILDFENGEEVEGYADPNQLRQVVWNLSRNALQAMPNGGKLAISSGKYEDESVWIAFCDEGVGIEDEKLDKVFLPFATEFKDGTGLGLAIVYRIIKSHNGNITVDKNPERGVTVKVTLPPSSASLGKIDA
ncbi:nitrogen regulation protein NR(II), partial [Acidobacteriota bacterium]